jgi:hypothetical protein
MIDMPVAVPSRQRPRKYRDDKGQNADDFIRGVIDFGVRLATRRGWFAPEGLRLSSDALVLECVTGEPERRTGHEFR